MAITARIRRTEILERGKSQVTFLKCYEDGAQLVPTSGTYTFREPNGETKIVNEVALSIDGDGTASYTHSASQLSSSRPLGEGYIQEFTLTIDGEEYTFRRLAALALRKLYPTVSDVDLTEVYTDLESLRPSSITSYQKFITSSWLEILRRIKRSGTCYSYLIMSPESFHDALLHLTLYKIWRDFHSALGQSQGRYLDLSQLHYKEYQYAYSQISLVVDETHENKATEPNNRTALQPVIYLSGTPPYQYRNRFYRWRY